MRNTHALLILLALAPAAPVFSEETKEVVVQKECMVLEGKGLEEVKKELLLAARRSAVEQLFGSLVTSLTQVENLALKKDEIQAATMGYLRIEGSPEFSNGQNLGELCVKIQAYATAEDRAKLKPKELSKKTCVAEGDVNTIRKRAEERATLEVLTDHDGTLKQSPPAKVLQLLHEIQFTEGGFVPETTTYCVRVAGIIYPVEVTALSLQNEGTGDSETRMVPGLRGEYFNSPPFQQGSPSSFPNRPEYVRVDRSIDFDWHKGVPAPRVSADYFLIRWSGEIYAPITGTYHFKSNHNEGMQLRIDGKFILQDWKAQGSKRAAHFNWDNNEHAYIYSAEGDSYLEGGRWYRIEIEFFAGEGFAFITLEWRPPGKDSHVLPTENLRTQTE